MFEKLKKLNNKISKLSEEYHKIEAVNSTSEHYENAIKYMELEEIEKKISQLRKERLKFWKW